MITYCVLIPQWQKKKVVSKRRQTHTHLLQMVHNKVTACSSHGAWYSVIKIDLRLHFLTQCQCFRVLLENSEEVSCNNTNLVIYYNGKTSRCCFKLAGDHILLNNELLTAWDRARLKLIVPCNRCHTSSTVPLSSCKTRWMFSPCSQHSQKKDFKSL